MILLCIILDSGNFISIDSDNSIECRKIDTPFMSFNPNETFQKVYINIKPGHVSYDSFNWDMEDYQRILSDDECMYALQHKITPNPKYIDSMKSNLRELKINKVIDDDTNS